MAGFVGLVRRKCLKVDRHREQISNDLFDKAEGRESLWTLLLLKLTDTWRQVENHARRLRRIENQTMEGLDINEADFQQLLDELTDAKKMLYNTLDTCREIVSWNYPLTVLTTFSRTTQICHSWSLMSGSRNKETGPVQTQMSEGSE